MPYKKPYQASTMKGSMQKTMGKHMGSQGKSVSIKPMYNMSKSTKRTKFPKG